VTLILIFSIPIVILFYYLFVKDNLSGYKRASLLATAGLGCSALLFALFYWHIGLLANYGSSILGAAFDSVNGANQLHNFKDLIKSYLRDAIIIAGYTSWLFLALFLISIVGQRMGDRVAYGLLFLAALIVITLLSVLGLSIDFSAFAVLKVSFGVVILLSAIFLLIRPIEDKNITLLLLAGITTMAITPVGSGSGLVKLFYGMWLILPLSILLTYKMTREVRSDAIFSIMHWLKPILPVMLILALFFHATNIYRDNQNRFELNTGFSDRSLSGIYSTRDRVKVIDELLSQLQKYANGGEKILAASSIPLIHYLTKTQPSLGYSWPGVSTLDKIRERQRSLEKAERLPNLFVLSKVSTRDETWPNATIDGEGGDTIRILEYLKNEYINRLKYSLVWENSAFAIYSR
jgi:hypothetical protein